MASSPSPLLIWAAAGTLAAVSLAAGFHVLFGKSAPVDSGQPPVGTSARPREAVTREALVAHLAHQPGDGRSWVLLARLDLEADRFADAAAAYEKALATSPKVAADPTIWCEYADAIGMTQGGSLAGKPRELVMTALARNGAHPKALEMAGSAAFEAHDYDAAARYWRALLAQLPPGSPAHRELAAALARVERLAAEQTPR